MSTEDVKPFKLTAKQCEARDLIAGPARHIMLEGGGRCVSGDTVIDGQDKTIKELAELGEPISIITSRGVQMAGVPFKKGLCQMLSVELDGGGSVTVTPDHRFWGGKKWVKADSLLCGSLVAVRLYGNSLPESTLECGLSGLRAGVRSLMGKVGDWICRCFSDFHQYGQQLLPAGAFCQCGCALKFGDMGRTHIFEEPQTSFLKKPNIHVRHQFLPVDEDTPVPKSVPRSNMDGSPSPESSVLSEFHGVSPISSPFPCQHQGLMQFLRLPYLLKSFSKVWDSVLFRFCAVLCLSYDTPLVGGYKLDKVSKITITPILDYYTISVPTSEQYFANGILHHNSAKTFFACWAIATRALIAPGSRHAIVRLRLNHVMKSIWFDTWPKMMRLAYPQIKYEEHMSRFYVTLPGGSEVWFGGLDEPDNILGNEYATIFPNECSQIPYSAIQTVMTRLAQKVDYRVNVDGRSESRTLRLKRIYDQNPPMKSHWTYQMFHRHLDPESGKPLEHPELYACLQMNPMDNLDNISGEYVEELSNTAERIQRRFLRGEYSDDNPNALFNDITIDKYRVSDGEALPEFIKVVVSVDPSGAGDTENADNDAIGITVGALGVDGNAYLLEDCTVKAGPGTWGRVANSAFDRHKANLIVGEKNFGGEMVRFTIQATAKTFGIRCPPFKFVQATRGKTVRAEPIAALYENGKVRHVGVFRDLEDELLGFSTSGYTGEKSPNRADSWIWCLTELFPGIVREKENIDNKPFERQFEAARGRGFWGKKNLQGVGA